MVARRNLAARVAGERAKVRPSMPRFKLGALRRIGLGLAVTGIVAGTLAFTPAATVFTIFQPRQFSPILITQGELRTLPNLRHFGSLHISQNLRGRQYGSEVDAERAAGFHIKLPSFVPSGISQQRQFQIVFPETSTFTFNAGQARAEALRLHQRAPAMPPQINGTTISLATNAAAMTIYGEQRDIPSLVVGQTRVPRLSSNGASLHAIEAYLLSLPGVSKQLARQIEAIGNPTTTLPIPIPVNWAFAQHVTVQGHGGLLVGDNTGVASVVIWEDHAVIYGVAGALTQGQVLRIADSLR